MSLKTKISAIVAIYGSHLDAEEAIHQLDRAHFDMRNLSIVGRDRQTKEQVIGYYNSDDRMKYWGTMGAFWGGIWGMLFGSAFLVVPGIGPLVIAGPLVSWIAGALESALTGAALGVVGAGLYSIGIPRDSFLKYEKAIRSDKFVVVAHGTSFEV